MPAATRVYGYTSTAPRTAVRVRTSPRVYGYFATAPVAAPVVRSRRVVYGYVAPAPAAAPAATTTAAAPVRGPGECGEFFYWRNGRCIDARVTPPAGTSGG